jgi:hypothetical protein
MLSRVARSTECCCWPASGGVAYILGIAGRLMAGPVSACHVWQSEGAALSARNATAIRFAFNLINTTSVQQSACAQRRTAKWSWATEVPLASATQMFPDEG